VRYKNFLRKLWSNKNQERKNFYVEKFDDPRSLVNFEHDRILTKFLCSDFNVKQIRLILFLLPALD
jgi:hypothetical protein